MPQLEGNETRLLGLRAALADGDCSGTSRTFDEGAFVKAKRQKAVEKFDATGKKKQLPNEQQLRPAVAGASPGTNR